MHWTTTSTGLPTITAVRSGWRSGWRRPGSQSTPIASRRTSSRWTCRRSRRRRRSSGSPQRASGCRGRSTPASCVPSCTSTFPTTTSPSPSTPSPARSKHVSGPDALREELDGKLAAAQAEERLPSVSAVVFRGGDVLWQSALGLADVAGGHEATPQTQYRIGSITKTFTAVGIMQLRDAGELSLDDPLTTYLPESAHAPTVGRMLAHSSGLQREPPGEIWETMKAPSREELLAGTALAEQVVQPGLWWHYSNLAFALLGEVVARAHGGTWEEALQDRILDPLGLTRTTPAEVAPAASGYFVEPTSAIGAAVLTNTGAGASPEKLALDLAVAASEALPAASEAWRPESPPPAEVEPLLGPWWTEGHEIVLSWRRGRLEAKLLDGVPGRDTSYFEPDGEDRYRSVEGRERGELLRVVRDTDGGVEKLYFATYPLRREPSTF